MYYKTYNICVLYTDNFLKYFILFLLLSCFFCLSEAHAELMSYSTSGGLWHDQAWKG